MTFNKKKQFHDHDQNIDIIEYNHPSGLRHIHIENDFPEFGFALSLPTPPEDNTGMPHILEHLTLSGSHKYPTKDPFMSMINRSLAHEMNAFTSSLHTTYHFATSLENDFENLSDLYLDLVFNPLLRKKDFDREAWRIEKKDHQLKLKGVVLNEMLGVYSNPEYMKFKTFLKLVSPNTPLSYDSGGHPLSIPFLSYDNLIELHKNHYMASKAVLVTCGNINIEKLQNKVEETLSRKQDRQLKEIKNIALSHKSTVSHKYKKHNTSIIKNKEFSCFDVSVPGNENTPKEFNIIYTMSAPKNTLEGLYNVFMYRVLFEHPHSPLKQVSEKWNKKVDCQYIYRGMLDKDKGNPSALLFSISGSDLTSDRLSEFENDIHDLIDFLSQGGADNNFWLSLGQNNINMIKSQIGTSVMPAVLGISEYAVLNKEYKDSFNNELHIKHMMKTPPSLENVMMWCQSWLSSNPIKIVFSPDEKMINKWNKIQDQQLGEIIKQTNNISYHNNDRQLLGDEALPSLESSDLAINNINYVKPINIQGGHNHCAFSIFDVSSPNITYNILFDLCAGNFSNKEIMLLTLMGSIGNQLGMNGKTYEAQKIKDSEYDLTHKFSLNTTVSDVRGNPGLVFELYASSSKAFQNELIEAIKEKCSSNFTLQETHWRNVFSQKIDAINELLNSVNYQSTLANGAVFDTVSKMSFRNTRLNEFFKEHARQWLEDGIKDPLIAQKEMNEVLSKAFSMPCHIVGTGSKELLNDNIQSLSSLFYKNSWDDLSIWNKFDNSRYDIPKNLDHVKDKKIKIDNLHVSLFPASTLSNYCFRSQPGLRKNDPHYANLKIAIKLLEPFLHKHIREIGGAYGSYIQLTGGMIVLNSYRDPNIKDTFRIFEQCGKELDKLLENRDEQKLLEAKLSVFKSLCKPLTQLEKSQSSVSMILSGYKFDKKQENIKKMAKVSWDDIEKVRNYFHPKNENIYCSAVCDFDFILENSNIKEVGKDQENDLWKNPRKVSQRSASKFKIK